jgi:hypothetical protein
MDNNINNKKEEKKKRTRITKTKAERYEKEQKEILKRLNEIIGLDENNNKFILSEINNDKEKQEKIKGLDEEVKKYFAHGKWAYYKKEIMNEWLSLVRSIYKEMGYDIGYKQRMIRGEKHIEYSINKRGLG